MSIVKEFREFAIKGNVVDLAVGVIIGAAFGKIVASAVGDIVMPLVGTLIGGVDFSSLAFQFRDAKIQYGKFLQTCLDFLIIAWAFGKIVASAVGDIVMPLVGTLIGGVDFSSLAFQFRDAKIQYGKFLQTCLDFLIIAWAIFVAVKVINRLKRDEPAVPPTPPRQEQLLEEIRDLLKQK